MDVGPVLDLPATPAEAEAVRRDHLNHEGEIRAVGMLYYIGGGLMALGILCVAAPFLTNSRLFSRTSPIMLLVFVLCATVTVVWFRLGRGLRQFTPASRWGALILSALFVFHPVNFLVNAYILFVLLRPKSRMVFSPYYAEVRRLTWYLEPRRLAIVYALVGLTILLGVGIALLVVNLR